MNMINVNGAEFEVTRQYKEGAQAFFSCFGNPYKNGSKRYFQWEAGFAHASKNIISAEIAKYLNNKNKNKEVELDKNSLLKELYDFSSRLPKNISSWDATKTRNYKDALSHAMSKQKGSANVLYLALHSLRPYYKE